MEDLQTLYMLTTVLALRMCIRTDEPETAKAECSLKKYLGGLGDRSGRVGQACVLLEKERRCLLGIRSLSGKSRSTNW